MKQKTRKELYNEIKVLKAGQLYTLKTASEELNKCGCDKYMASGLIVTITDLSGREVVKPFMCADGLETETIKALQIQIKKTKDLTLILA